MGIVEGTCGTREARSGDNARSSAAEAQLVPPLTKLGGVVGALVGNDVGSPVGSEVGVVVGVRLGGRVGACEMERGKGRSRMPRLRTHA